MNTTHRSTSPRPPTSPHGPDALHVPGLVSFVATSMLLAAAGCSSHAAEGAVQVDKAQTPLRWTRAKPTTTSARDEVTGALFPAKMLPLGFEVGGRLARLQVQKGQLVKVGQPLGQLDVEISDAQVAQAQAAVAAAEAGAELARDVAGRNTRLQAEGSVSDVQNRSAQTTARQADAQLLAAKAQLAQAQAARRKHDLKALIAGTLIEAPDQIGGMVAPGTPVFILQQLDTLTLKTTVSETSRPLLKAGAKVKVQAAATGVSTDDAVLKLIIPSADPQTRRIPVEISVPNADGRFVANTLAKAVLPLGEARAAFAIPSTALGTTGGDHVWTARGSGELRKLPVTVLERRGSEVVVASGEPLDQVVDYPSGALVEGTRVSAVGSTK